MPWVLLRVVQEIPQSRRPAAMWPESEAEPGDGAFQENL